MILPLIMSSTGNMNKNWLMWKQCFLEYMEWNNDKQPEEYKINVLRSLLGHDALNDPSVHYILNVWVYQHKCCTLIRVLERLDHFFSDMKNELVERYNFFRRFQEKDEPIETYILDLIEKAKTCNFGNLRDSIVRDKVIASIHDKEHRYKLFQTLNLNLPKLLHICKAHEAQNKYNNIAEKRQTNALHSDKIAVVEASNSNNKKVAKGKQNSNDKVNAKINGKNIIGTTNQRHSNNSNKAKTDSRMHNSGSNIMSTACRENNANIGDKTKANPKNDKSGKAKTDTKMDNSGSNIINIACKENNNNIGDKTKTNPKNDKSGKTKTDTKMDNSGSNILNTADKENNTNIDGKTKIDAKNDKTGNNIIGTTNQRHSDTSNKAKTDSKIHNSGSDIMSTACRENNANIDDKTKANPKNNKSGKAKTDTKMDNSGSNILSTAYKENNTNIGDKTKTDAKNGDNVSNYIDLVSGGNTNDINDKAKIDSKGMNSNHNMNTARRNSVSSCTQYRQNCRKCNEKHADRSCPAWGHKCANCGERNHFPNCCEMKPLKTTEQHINMNSIENVLNTNHFQHNSQPQPIPPSNCSLVANIGPCYLPSAPEFCEIENELYPQLCDMSTIQVCAPLNPEATVGNTKPKTAATETENHKKRSNSDTCSIS